MTKETKPEAVRRALAERKARLQGRRAGTPKRARLEALLESRIWPTISHKILGSTITRDVEDRILGYGPRGH